MTLGDVQVETVINEEGFFTCGFMPPNFPPDGTYEAVVTVVTEGGEVVLDGPGYVIEPDAALGGSVDRNGLRWRFL
ncbi:hypothetical protein [Sulfitobacter geojensis]|uniref:hypothetical protein n=1 Tax=Sulfitobacter geojensis TaxID=1342299 RepID=UPI0036DE58DC